MTLDDLPLMEEMFQNTLKTWQDQARDQIAGEMPGTHSLSDNEFLVWWAGMVAQHPAVPIELPDGSMTVIASPWVLALPLTEDGKAEASRYNRIMSQWAGEMVA